MSKFSGEFIIHGKKGVEHVIPNSFTTLGMQQVLKSAFWNQIPTWYLGLCAHNPGDFVALANVVEPTIGTRGYARVPLHLDTVNWPTIANVNGESYVETRACQFTPSGIGFDVQINRLFLTDGANVIAISAGMEEGIHTVAALLTTSYRLYFR